MSVQFSYFPLSLLVSGRRPCAAPAVSGYTDPLNYVAEEVAYSTRL
jgi:hypothetical protein